MWTAILRQAEKVNGIFILTIEYSDGTDTVKRRYRLERVTKKSIKNIAIGEVTKLAAMKAEVIDFPIDQSMDITPDPIDPPTPPTAAQIAQEEWFRGWDRMLNFMKLVDAGLLPADDSRITTLRTTLTADWKNAYLEGV